MSSPADDEAPHLTALRQAARAGFVFRSLWGQRGAGIVALYGQRQCRSGVVENVTVRSMREAVAARFRHEDFPHGDPLWQRIGEVSEVVTDLLELPGHGERGAPVLARRAHSALWLPGGR